MAYEKTIWQAREGEGLNRFLKQNETSTHITLKNDPTNITNPGEPFSVYNMNKIEQGIYNAHERLDSDYGSIKMLLFQPTEYELAKMRLLPLEGQVVSIATYQRLCDRMYVGDNKNATADWWYKISNPNDKNSRDTDGAYMVVLDFRGLFPRAAGVNSKYKAANDTPLFTPFNRAVFKKYECLACKAVFVYDAIKKPLKTQRDGGVQ